MRFQYLSGAIAVLVAGFLSPKVLCADSEDKEVGSAAESNGIICSEKLLSSAARSRVELIPRADVSHNRSARETTDEFAPGSLFEDLPYFDIEYRNQRIKGLMAAPDKEFDSIRIHSAEGRVPPETQVVMQLWHGFGSADSSHMGSLLDPLRRLSNKQDRIRKRIERMLEAQGSSWVNVAPEALDLPESGHGPETEWSRVEYQPTNGFSILQDTGTGPFGTVCSTMQRLASYTKTLKADAGNLPIVNLSRSAGVGLAAELDHRYPQLLAGLIFIGPTHPDPVIGFDHSTKFHRAAADQKLVNSNWPAFHWINAMYRRMQWHDFLAQKTKPLLILIGEYDQHVSPKAREWFKRLSEHLSHVRYVEIAGAGHDVLLPSSEQVAEGGVIIPNYKPDEAYAEIHRFLNEEILGNQ